MWRRLPNALAWVLVASVPIVACNVVTGVLDLEVDRNGSPSPTDAGGLADVIDGGSSLPDSGGPPTDAEADAPAGDSGCGVNTTATKLLGVATPVAPYFQLTPDMNALAGGIASATTAALDDFDASFSYSLTYTSQETPGAGLAFFAIASAAKDLQCAFGPNLCTLGASAPGFAVILRTSKVNASDPAVPYVAVVDAQTFPAVQPTNPTAVTAAKAGTLVGSTGTGVPPTPTFHVMTISVRQGKVTATIDGDPILSSVAIPSWVAGRVGTWGIGAATGQGSTFAERTVVGDVSFRSCP